MGVLLFIVKEEKPEYFDLNKGFNELESINEWGNPDNYELSIEDLKQDLLKNWQGKRSKDIDEWAQKLAERLYKWMGNDIVYQTYDTFFDYEFDEKTDYEETGSRFDYLYDGDTYIGEDEESL